MFALLTESEVITQKDRKEAYQRLSELSSKATNGLAGIDPHDILHVWWEILKNRSPHVQIQKLGVTPKAFHDLGVDVQRKGGECKPVSLDAEKAFVNSMADESTGVESEELIDKEFLQLLSANQPMIEEILHRNAKIAKRRFSVMQMLAREPHLTWVEIARQLDTSPQTIGLDRDAIKDKWPLIQEAIYS